jgi:hypothetical protein
MNEDIIIAKALERLNQNTGFIATWKPDYGEIDGKLDLFFEQDETKFFVEVKTELRQHQLPKLLEMAKKFHPFMVVAENIFPTLKEVLREKKIAYLDAAGNIYLNTEGKFVWIDGNKPIEEKKTVTNRAFTKTGLKTVFYLLLDGEAINMPYRKLAATTDVALGNIKNVIEGLKDAGYVLQINDTKLKIQNRRALLDRWITGYRETLKPALHLGTYKLWKNEKLQNWKDLPTEKQQTVWGGEPAAEFYTSYLTPAILTLYTNQYKSDIMTKWTLVPAEKGDVELYKKFWKNLPTDETGYAPPLLVYADLIITDDPRCIETAEMIYQKYLKNEFENN